MTQRHDTLLARAVTAWVAKGNTPEEFGEVLETATTNVPSWYGKEHRRQEVADKAAARCRIQRLIGNAETRELLELERTMTL